MSAGRWRRLVVVLLIGLGATGCQVSLRTDLDVRADGSGTVRAAVGFDDEALEALGDLSVQLAADDLRQAGWSVSEPRREGVDVTWVRATKAFDDPGGATRILSDLGPVFDGLRLEQQSTLLRTRTALRGALDLTDGLGALADPALVEALGPELFESDEAASLARQLTVELAVDLPGRVGGTGQGESPGGRRSWSAATGGRVAVSAVGVVERTVLLVAGVASATVVAGAILAVVMMRRRSR